MDAQRLDLGPNRWMAAGGLAFIHVRVWKGWLTQISVAPVRDAIVGRATLFGLPHRPVTNAWLAAFVLFGVLCFPEILFWLFGSGKGHVDWITGFILILIPVAILLGRIWRRERLGIFLSDEQPDLLSLLNRTYFSDTQAKDPEILTFCDYLTTLKMDAGDGKRMARTYIVIPWWVHVVLAFVLMLVIGLGLYFGFQSFGFEDPAAYLALVGDIVLFAIIFALAPERSLLFNRELRRAYSCLLADDAEGAANIVQPILDTNPKHRYANHLLTLARLMQCDLERAEDLVIQQYNPCPNLPSRYHRIMDYKLWESRHDDSTR